MQLNNQGLWRVRVTHATDSAWLAGGRTCAQIPAPYCTIKAACKDEWLAGVTLQCHDCLQTCRHLGPGRKRNVLLLGAGSNNDPCSQVLTNKSTRKSQETVFLIKCVQVIDTSNPSNTFSAKHKPHSNRIADKVSQNRQLQLVSIAWTWHAPFYNNNMLQQHAEFVAGSIVSCNKL